MVTIDVSFISLRLILPALPPVLAPGADVVALVKPQFEAGRDEVGRGGLVKDPAVHEAVLARVTASAASCGLVRVAHDAVAHHRRDREPGVPDAPAAGLSAEAGGGNGPSRERGRTMSGVITIVG